MQSGFTRDKALELLKEYNKDEFHIRHGITLENIMKYFAKEFDSENEEYWAVVGLLHDVDFEKYPETHLDNTPDILKSNGGTDELVYSIVSHGYGICTDVKPEHFMEKILYATDELSGLIYATSLMRPSKSTKDMKLKSVKKKFKDKKFAAGCSRDVIKNGAEMLDWELDDLITRTLHAMQDREDEIERSLEEAIC